MKPSSIRFKTPWNRQTARRVLMVGLASAGASVLLLSPFWPFLTAPFWPTVWDLGGHSVPMREWGSWLVEGRTIGWDHSWFNGYPVYQFYFPGGWFIWQLFNVVLPEATAYRAMTAAAFPALALTVWWLARTWGLTLTRSAVLAACVPLGFVIAPGVTLVAAGLYAHNWSVVFGLVYLGALNKTDGHRWGTWTLVGFLSLAAAFLSHPYPAVFIGAASLLMLGRVGWRNFTKGVLLVAGVTAWWWLPAVAHLDLAYVDMTRWAIGWDSILMFRKILQLTGLSQAATPGGALTPAATVAVAGGAAAVLALAGFGAYRLARTVPDRRVLYPFAAMMALPFVNRLARTFNVADEATEIVGFQGGRMFYIWQIAVPTLAVYAVVTFARDAIPKLRTARPAMFAAGVSVPLISAAALLTLTVPEMDVLLTANTGASWAVSPASVDARTQTATWYAASVFVVDGPAAFDTHTADTGRNVRGLHRESSATARFLSAMPLPEWLAAQHWHDHTVPAPTATRTTWPVPQLQTFGTDLMWEPPSSASELPASRFRLLDVPPPPESWALVWISPTAIGYRGFLDRSLEAFGSWETTDDVTIPVWADPPTSHSSDIAATADVDWSDDHYVRFRADQRGLYYAPSSWHPNWTLTTEGTGPWPAGPNQMIVLADTAGLVELVWGKHWSESVGQAVSAVTLLSAAVISLSALRRRGRL